MSTTAISSSSSTPSTSTSATTATPTSTSFNAQQANQAAGQSIISALGSGSGVNVNALAQNLVNAEEIPQKNIINSKIQKNDSTISGLSGVMYIMQSFQTSMSALQDKSNFNTLQVANTNTNALGVTTDNTASPGSHNVQINAIAQAQETLSTGFASNTSPVNGGVAFSINITGQNGVSNYSVQPLSSSTATLQNVSFGTEPSVNDFKNFSITVNGQPLSITPAPATATLSDLASNLQSQLQSLQGNSDLTVTANAGNLIVTSASGKLISNVTLSPTATVTVGTPPGVNLGTSNSGTLSGISFGSPASTNDFSSLMVEIGGVTQTITPSLKTTSVADMATALQSQLQTAFGPTLGPSITVKANGANGLVISSNSATVNYVTLSPKSGSNASGGTFNNSSIAGISFGSPPSTSDFQVFSILVGGNPMTIYPSPSIATPASLAASVQAQLNRLDASQFNGTGSDITVSIDSKGVMNFKSASGRSIADPQFMEFPATPDGISQAINAKNLGITSNVINTGNGSAPYEIMLTSKVGVANKFIISDTTLPATQDQSNLFGKVNLQGVYSQTDIQNAQDASLLVDGVTYTRATNSINDILTGVTLTLNAVTPVGTPASINMTRDTTTLVTNINAMVSAYNDAVSVLNAVSDPKSTLATYGGTLVGDSTVMLLKQKLRDMMLSQSSTPGANIGSLWQMGISVDAKGVLSVNSTVLTSSLNNNFNDIVKTFTGNNDNSLSLSSSTASGGIAGDAVKQLTTLLSATGPITTRSNDLTTQNQTFENDLSTLQVRMDALLARYQTQFAAMDTLVGQTNAERTSLTATFNGMMAMYTNK